ncbi:MAG: hypothetical protein WA397_21190 [Roseiarcus sp.]
MAWRSFSRWPEQATAAAFAGAGAKGWPTANAVRATHFLDKIGNLRYVFRLTESLSRSPVDGREDEKPWLFETLAYNLPRGPERRSGFLNSIARNPLKRLDSEK